MVAHVTKKATMPMYGEYLKTSSSSKSNDRSHWNFKYSICPNDTPWLTFDILVKKKKKYLLPYGFVWKRLSELFRTK